MLLEQMVLASERVTATASRSEKIAILADLLRRVDPDEIPAVTGFLTGRPRQGRIGVGWATLAGLDAPAAAAPSLRVADLDAAIDEVASVEGPGSGSRRSAIMRELLGRATEPEAAFVRALLTGELRQGALEGVLTEAIARAGGTTVASTRRALMLSGDLGRTAAVALRAGESGLTSIGLTPMRPVLPMLASGAGDVDEALAAHSVSSVEWKLDGQRMQVHRIGDEVRAFTRNLNEMTDRVPEVVAAVRDLPVHTLVVDGELLGIDAEERPQPFQDTMSLLGREHGSTPAGPGLRPYLFDVLHVDGTDLIDAPLSDRLGALEEIAAPLRVPNLLTADPAEAADFLSGAIQAGHEGVVIKAIDAPYTAGRRGKSWRKLKPVHTYDLVVLAAEWGHGRRRGWLSNLHLGARADEGGGFVMVGKTFKGLTDELLRWQTAQLLDRELGRDGIVVHVRPELVVEIAIDGVQASTRYPGGLALRFARVRRYRPEKGPDDADTIGGLAELLGGAA